MVPPASSDSKSAATPVLELTTPVQFLKGVGPKRAPLFERLGISTLADLIRHIPHRYEHEREETAIAELPFDQVVSARGEIAATRVAGRGRSARFEATLDDESGRLHLTWFNGAYLKRRIHPGMLLRVQGKVKRYQNYRQMANPKWEALADETTEAREERYRPIYPATEDLSSEQIEKIAHGVLDEALELIDDHLDDDYRKSRELPSLRDAYRMAHRPEHEAEAIEGRRRLAFDEMLLLQLGVAMRRRQLRETARAPALTWNDAIEKHILERFPFELTESQRRVIEEIRTDLQREAPMNRLLQGDVGAGKTVVALYGMLMAAASRRQSALLAPTEILAEQHYSSITSMLEGSNLRIELLTGTLSAADRESIERGVDSGEVDIVIGTHALLSERLRFDKLALIIIDEQHRFGVEQRATLRRRAMETGEIPHTLIMTATPIPRTLSLTLFGDLDVSTIHGLPPGRQPVVTRVVGPDQTEVVYDYIAGRLREGEQAYIVLPAIDETEATDLKAVRSHLEWLESGPFEGLRCAAVHGRLKRPTRETIMYRFRKGKIDAIVATTVIEVGVDVPNASIMVVEHAERFGLSQLHQLRGRVGRGSRKSLCVFIGDPSTDDAKARLDAIGSTSDGFEIAEKDFEIRGMGEIFGARQSGLPPFRVARLPDDLALLQLARRDAAVLIDNDPDLSAAPHRLLRQRLMKTYGEGLGIGDVG
ncbi:MAG: ATP-dependent DNA helicase RecG [Phycisphaerales bacterium]